MARTTLSRQVPLVRESAKRSRGGQERAVAVDAETFMSGLVRLETIANALDALRRDLVAGAAQRERHTRSAA